MTAEAPTQDAVPALRLRGVGRRFGGLLACDAIDLEVSYCERRAILGPNGAGKTTLFNLVCGDFPVTAGTVELLGRDVTALPARARAKMGLARTYQQSRLWSKHPERYGTGIPEGVIAPESANNGVTSGTPGEGHIISW